MTFFRCMMVTALVVLMSAPVKAVEKRDISLSGLEVAVWVPDSIDGPRPLVVFSHGYLGCNEQSAFLTEGLARAGYVVMAPNHLDTTCVKSGSLRRSFEDRIRERRSKGQSINLLEPERSFFAPEAWDHTTHTDRRDDIVKTLELALAHPEIRPMIDFDRIGLMGHSMGGYAALGVAGAWPSWKDNRIKAVLALSPYSLPFHAGAGNLRNLDAPVMYQGGTADLGITPFLRGKNGSYALSGAPKYLVEFDDFNHFSWTNLNDDPAQKQLALHFAREFFDKYLRRKKVRSLNRKRRGVSILRYEE